MEFRGLIKGISAQSNRARYLQTNSIAFSMRGSAFHLVNEFETFKEFKFKFKSRKFLLMHASHVQKKNF